ncbi:MAG: hypothetical protein ACR2I0_06860 [Rhodoferax sp.]
MFEHDLETRRPRKAKKSKALMEVVLGSQTIKAFVVSPKGFNVIGIVRLGQEFGLLAVTESGKYVRVNGSRVEALCDAQARAAIVLAHANGRARQHAHGREFAAISSPLQYGGRPMASAPTVVVRKRRRLSDFGVSQFSSAGAMA